MLPAPVLVEAIVKTTALPEAPPVAARLTVSLEAKAIDGEANGVKLMVWLALLTVRRFPETWAAAL